MINALMNFYQAHPAICAAVGTWLLGNLCSAMPSPTADSGKSYQFLFNFASAVGSALPRSVPKLRIGSTKETTGDVVDKSEGDKQP